MFQHQLCSDTEFGIQIGKLKSAARHSWDLATVLAVDAIRHHHEHSYAVDRPKALYAALEEEGLGSHLSAFVNLLRVTTPISGIGDTWKGTGDKAKFEKLAESWESVLSKLEADDSKGLFSFSPQAQRQGKEKVSKIKQSKARTTLKVSEQIPEPVKNALQAAIDKVAELTPEQQANAVKRLSGEASTGSLLDRFPEDLRPLAEEFLMEYIEVGEEFGWKHTRKSLTVGLENMRKHRRNSLEGKVDAVHKAARKAVDEEEGDVARESEAA